MIIYSHLPNSESERTGCETKESGCSGACEKRAKRGVGAWKRGRGYVDLWEFKAGVWGMKREKIGHLNCEKENGPKITLKKV